MCYMYVHNICVMCMCKHMCYVYVQTYVLSIALCVVLSVWSDYGYCFSRDCRR